MTTAREVEGDDPYRVLGVGRGASAAEISRAYRKQAKEHHPDLHQGKGEVERNAHEAQFRRAAWANEILSDGVEREYFDRHGHSRRDGAGGPKSAAERMVVDLFTQGLDPLNEDVERTDYVAKVRMQLEAQLGVAQKELKAMREALKRLKKMVGRFRREGDEVNPLGEVVEGGVRTTEALIAEQERKLRELDAALAEVRRYTYDQTTDDRDDLHMVYLGIPGPKQYRVPEVNEFTKKTW